MGTRVNVDNLRAVGRDVSESTEAAKAFLRELGPRSRHMQGVRGLSPVDVAASIGRFEPDRISIRQMRQMRRDTMVALGLWYITAPLVNASWTIECEDPKVGGFVRGALERIYVSLILGMSGALSFGYQAGVKRFELVNPDWTFEDSDGVESPVWDEPDVKALVWNEPKWLPPEGASVVFSEDGLEFAGFEHELVADDAGGRGLVPPSHAIWFTNERVQSFGDWYGYPRSGYAFRYWWSYWHAMLLGDRHMETDADPPLIIYAPPGKGVDQDGQTVDNMTLAMSIGDALRDGATVAIPSDVYEDAEGKPSGRQRWDAKFLTGGENMGVFMERFQYLDLLKLRSMLVPDEALTRGSGGILAGNAAGAHADIFTESLAILKGEMDLVINDHMIPDLVAQNFVDAPPARIVTTGFRAEDLSLVTDIVKMLVSLDPENLALDAKELARKAGLPQIRSDQPRETAAGVSKTSDGHLQERASTRRADAMSHDESASSQFIADLGFVATDELPTAPGWMSDPEMRILWTRLVEETSSLMNVVMWDVIDRLRSSSLRMDIASSMVDDSAMDLIGPAEMRMQGLLVDVVFRAGTLAQTGITVPEPETAWTRDVPWVRAMARDRAASTVLTALKVTLGEVRAAIAEIQETTPGDPQSTADALRDRLGGDRWQARRLARSEMRRTSNLAQIGRWRDIGVRGVIVHDGHGGLTGQTDAGCLARDGRRVSLDEAERMEFSEETHPNCTLSFSPDPEAGIDVSTVELPPIEEED